MHPCGCRLCFRSKGQPVLPDVCVSDSELEPVCRELLLIIGGDAGQVPTQPFAVLLRLVLSLGLLEQHVAVLVAISALSAGVLVTNAARLRRFAANLQITIDHEVWGLQTALLAQKELVLVHLRRANG